MERCDIILTTGGLGPTVDDPTRDAIALAFETKTEFQPELWDQIQSRFQRVGRQPTENNKRQAYVPLGALIIENPVGTAPSFIMETEKHAIIALPGVPREMEYLIEHAVLPYLRNRYHLTGMIKARILHSAGVGESQIDELIGDLETLSNPTIGLAAHSGQVDIRITAKANSEAEANSLIQPVETEIRNRLGTWIYGADEETLEKAALNAAQKQGWSLAVMEAGLGGDLLRRLASAAQEQQTSRTSIFRGGEVIADLPTPQELHDFVQTYRSNKQVDICLGVAVYPGTEKRDVHIVLITPEGQQQFTRPYGGPPEYAPRWALHHSLDFLRKI
jgi:molybdopterin-biosynthesis enzyme MoeA-like protein